MQLDSLNEHFGLPGVLVFRTDGEPGDLIFASITTPHATATVYLQGAHLTAWQPAGHAPVLFTSRDSEVAPGKAIRGGVPIAFPWFATRHDGKPGPSHGFARIQEWTLAFAALSGENLHLTFTLGPTELSRSLGYDQFRLAFELVIGRDLSGQDGRFQTQGAAWAGDVHRADRSGLSGYGWNLRDPRCCGQAEHRGGEGPLQYDGGVEPVGYGRGEAARPGKYGVA
jgi:hypothetical protein